MTFSRYIGIDYSGAQTPSASLKGVRIYAAEGEAAPVEILPPQSPRKYWTRKGVASWLVERLAEDAATLVGIDHGFSFPLLYFEAHRLEPDWAAFVDDFQRHWPTDEDNTYVDFVRDGTVGDGAARMGDARWRRLIASTNCGAEVCQSSTQRWPPVRRRGSGACQDTRRSNRPCGTTFPTNSDFPDSMFPTKLNPVEPPWYGPVCPVVWEGRC